MEDDSYCKKIEPFISWDAGAWVLKTRVCDNRIVSGTNDGKVHYYSMDSYKKISTINLGSEITDIIMKEEYCIIATKGDKVIKTDFNGNILKEFDYDGVWKINTFKDNYLFSDRNGGIFMLNHDFSPKWSIISDAAWDVHIENNYIYVASTDLSVTVIDAESGKKLWRKVYKYPVYACVTYENKLCVGTSEGKIEIIDKDYKVCKELNTSAVRILKSSIHGILAGLANNSLIYLNDELKIIWTYNTDSWIKDIYCDKNNIIVGSADNNVYLLNFEGKCLGKYKTGSSVLSVDKHDNIFVAASADGRTYAFNMANIGLNNYS